MSHESSHEELLEQQDLTAGPNDQEIEKEINELAEEASQINQRVKELEEKLNQKHDHLMRSIAELENVRRRAQQDVEKAHKYGTESLIKELLQVIDSLELALNNVPTNENSKAIREGIQLTLKKFLSILHKHGVEQINPIEETFNSEFHEAVSTQFDPDVEPDTIVNVLQKGYLLSGRLVRPALVVVAKK